MTHATTTSDSAGSCFSDDAARWEAVARRDQSADGHFYYSVDTTGVYCRPSCPARRPRQENVRFHPSGEAAERAGFRPCKRCRPDQAALREEWAAAVARACRSIEAAEETPTLADLASAAGMSRFHFHRVFRSVTGVTPKGYVDAWRARRMREELARRETVAEAIYEAGFGSNRSFYAASLAELGMTPTDFRSGGQGVVIRFAVGACTLGAILVAASERGVCAIMLGDDPEQLVSALDNAFPEAELVGGDSSFEHLVAQVVAFVEAPGIGLDLPLDVRGTAFQRRVWSALREIPLGSTASYAEIAARLGAPRSARAVAGACAANNIAIAIPCHRVVHRDGTLSGYRWGVERKRALLERESVSAERPGGFLDRMNRV